MNFYNISLFSAEKNRINRHKICNNFGFKSSYISVNDKNVDSFVPSQPQTNQKQLDVQNNELSAQAIKNAFDIKLSSSKAEKITFKETAVYQLLNNLGLNEIRNQLEEKLGEKEFSRNIIEINLPNNDIIEYDYKPGKELLELSSKTTFHELELSFVADEFSVFSVQDKNYNFTLFNPINKLTDKQTAVLKNSINYFKTFKDKTPAEESTDYLSLGGLIPKHKGILYKKIKTPDGAVTKIPVEVDIVKENGNTFNFMNKGEKIGFLKLNFKYGEDLAEKNSLCHDFLPQHVFGDRIIVDYTKNCKPAEYGGVGELADLVSVACCKELNIKPNILSLSLAESAPLHYKRGKRFIPFNSYSDSFKLKYNGINPDELIKKVIDSPLSGGKYDTETLTGGFITYMPRELIKHYEEKLKTNPIF